jgi:hypothetical protein
MLRMAEIKIRAISAPGTFPRPSMKAATLLCSSASRSSWLVRMALSLVSRIQPRLPISGSQTASLGVRLEMVVAGLCLEASVAERPHDHLSPRALSTKKVYGSGSFKQFGSYRVLNFFRRK